MQLLAGVCIRFDVVLVGRGAGRAAGCDVVPCGFKRNVYVSVATPTVVRAVRLYVYRNRCVRYTYSRCRVCHTTTQERTTTGTERSRAQRLSRTRVRATGPRAPPGAPRSGSAYPVAAPPCAPLRASPTPSRLGPRCSEPRTARRPACPPQSLPITTHIPALRACACAGIGGLLAGSVERRGGWPQLVGYKWTVHLTHSARTAGRLEQV